MKAVVFAGPREVTVQDVADAALEEPTDVLLRVTSSAICGTDLHMYDGRTGATPGLVLGHEPLGVVEQAARPSSWSSRATGWSSRPTCTAASASTARAGCPPTACGSGRAGRRRLRLRRDGPVPGRAGRAAPGALR